MAMAKDRRQVQGYPIIGALFAAYCVCAWRRHARLSITCIVYPHQAASLLGHRASRSFASQTPPDCPPSHRHKCGVGAGGLFDSLRTRSIDTDALQCALQLNPSTTGLEQCEPNLNLPRLPAYDSTMHWQILNVGLVRVR